MGYENPPRLSLAFHFLSDNNAHGALLIF